MWQAMSRQQEQIETIAQLLNLWLSAPDLRLGQLLENIFGCNPLTPTEQTRCIFYTNDENIREKMKVFEEICKPTVFPYSK